MKRTDKAPKQNVGAYILSAALIAVLVIAALLLNRPDPDAEATAAQKRIFCVAQVTQILSDNAQEDEWTEGRRIGQQILLLEVLLLLSAAHHRHGALHQRFDGSKMLLFRVADR